MTEVKYYEADDFFFEFMSHGDPFKGTLSTRYPELDEFIDQINFGSRNARRRYASGAHNDVGMDADLLMGALAQVTSRRREEIAVAAAEGDDSTSEAERFLMFKLEDMDAFYSSDETCYVSFRNGDHLETWPTDSYRFGQHLRGIFYAKFEHAIDSADLKRVIETLKAKTLHEGVEREVSRRVAMHDGALYIDLGDPDWQVIRVGKRGWEVVSESPVKFIRNRTTRSLPMPEEGGSIDDLRPFLNVEEDDFKLTVAWVLGALHPTGPYPLIELTGQQGSSKSTAAKVLTRLVDPKDAPLRSMPTSERDLAITTSHVRLLAFDNVSFIRPELSDALCRVSTGGGLATRKLYTDDEEMIFDVKRPIIVNAINTVVVRGDLQERTVPVLFLPIPEDQRRPEDQFWAAFDGAHPRIFGAILDVLASILNRHDSVQLDNIPRMADFARWVTAAEKALGWEDGEFIEIYAERQKSASVDAMDNDMVVNHIRVLLERKAEKVWSGTATELLDALNMYADDADKRLKNWPKAANTLSKYLRRIAPQLGAIGIRFTESDEGHAKTKIKTLEITEGYTPLPRSDDWGI